MAMEKSVTNIENEELSKVFTEDEIWAALFQMAKKKTWISTCFFDNMTKHLDDFSIEFYGVLDLYETWYKRTLDIKRLNYVIITLLPKVKKASVIYQYRLICLLNCIYKWFTKVETIRCQPTFIGGRHNMKNILALYEILH
jgi:hypothetical protein